MHGDSCMGAKKACEKIGTYLGTTVLYAPVPANADHPLPTHQPHVAFPHVCFDMYCFIICPSRLFIDTCRGCRCVSVCT